MKYMNSIAHLPHELVWRRTAGNKWYGFFFKGYMRLPVTNPTVAKHWGILKALAPTIGLVSPCFTHHRTHYECGIVPSILAANISIAAHCKA